MFIHNINPVLFSIGPFEIRYYGLFFVLGILFVYYYLKQNAIKEGLFKDKAELESFMTYLVIGLIFGARFFHVFVYNPGYYLDNPNLIYAVWKGGLSFHGGALGAFLATYIFAKKKKKDFLMIADMVVIPAALGLSLGRIANFINGELFGRTTTLPWAVKFPGAEGFRHPSQIYESFKNFVIFLILLHLKRKNLPKGSLLSAFFIFYSIFRTLIEFVREPTEYGLILGFITFGQILNVIMLILVLVIAYKKNLFPFHHKFKLSIE